MTTLKLSLSLTNPPRRVPIEITADSSAKNLFQVASEATKIPPDNLKLIFRGRIIANSNEDGGNVVDEFKLEDGSVIHCMGKPVEGNGPVTSTAPVVATASTGPAAAAGRNVESSPAVPIPPPLENALARMKSNHSVAEYKAALDTLTKLLSNVIQHPMEEKYRKVKKSNPVFHKRLGRLTGATETLSAIGFCSVVGGGGGDAANDDGEEYYVLTPSPDAWPKLLQSKETIDQAVRNHEVEQQQQQQRQTQNSGNPSSFLGNSFQSGMNPMNFQSGMGAAGVDPSVMSNILSNPNALRDLLQNPALQQMMQNHPYFANNPMMMEQMRMLANNPQMMDQISRMMSDPMQVSRMNDMMNRMQGGNGLGFGTGSSGGTGSMNMSQQMEIMRQMANLSRDGSSSSSNSSAAGDGIHPSSTFTAQMSNSANNTTTTREHSNVNPSTTATSNSRSSSSNNNNSRNGSEMTEEEMIAEAIARSLREQ